MQVAEVVNANPLPQQMSVWDAPGYSITFHTSALPMAGTSSQVQHLRGLGLRIHRRLRVKLNVPQ